MKSFSIAVIAGDGIGKEVVPEGIRVLEAAGRRFGFQFNWHEFDWSCATFLKNNEGEYSDIGGRLYEETDEEMAVQQTVFTRRGVNRVMRYAFELAQKRNKHVTSATKSNGIIHTMPFWDERFRAVAAEYPHIRTDQYH